ncbi:MAG TPA: hypothetical protein PLY73_10680, partial [Candidatus Ozemobacteraceae bacterium]|nr:hypothetical protein [Candidatus Ozemobacteraceae bacterium]
MIPLSERFNPKNDDIRYSIQAIPVTLEQEAAMKAGFTERVFHGTGANIITKFRLGSKSHGVKAAYFSYDRGAASSYAALAKLDGQDNAHVEEYLVNPGRMLEVDAADTPDFGGFGDFLKKAKSDGYDSVKVTGLLDDQHLRLDDDGEIVFPDYEWYDAAPTDVLIVFDSRRIKMVKSGVPLSNRFDLGVDDTRYSMYSPYQSGRFGAGTILSAIIATDKVKGIKRTDEAYQQLATALRTKTDVAKAKAEADSFLRREARAASMDVSDIAQSMTQEKFPELVEKLFAKGSDYGVEVGTRAQQGMMRAEKNAIEDARGATLHDMVADTGVDIARILLSVYPEAFDPSLEERRAKAKEKEKEKGEGGAVRGEFVGPPTEEQVAERTRLDAERKRKAAILVAKLQAWRLQMAEAKAREERDAALRAEEEARNAEAAAEKSDEELDAEDEADMQELIVPPEIIADSGVDLNDALEFAHFLRLWVESWLAGPGVEPGATLGDRINVAKFRKTMIAQLGDIAHKWLDPDDARTAVSIERQIASIPDSADPDTIEKRTASIIATIQRAVIRQNRDRLIKEARESIAKLALAGRQVDEMEKDVKRKIKGEHEKTARYVSDILSWGPQRIEREMVRLDNIVNDRDAAYAAAQAEHGKDVRMASDVQVHRALERRAALERWGGLKHKLPADILRGKAEIEAWLKTERLAHEAKWESQKAKWDRLAEIVQKAATRDSRRAKPGRLGIMGRFADETSSTIRQKLEAIMQGGGAEAAEAIAQIEDMFNEGSQKLGFYRAK